MIYVTVIDLVNKVFEKMTITAFLGAGACMPQSSIDSRVSWFYELLLPIRKIEERSDEQAQFDEICYEKFCIWEIRV